MSIDNSLIITQNKPMNIVLSIIGIALGIAIIVFAYDLEHKVMHFGLFEKQLGPGGGTNGYKITGLLIILFSIMVMFGFLDTSGDNLNGSQDNEPVQSAPTEQQPTIPDRNSGPAFAQ